MQGNLFTENSLKRKRFLTDSGTVAISEFRDYCQQPAKAMTGKTFRHQAGFI